MKRLIVLTVMFAIFAGVNFGFSQTAEVSQRSDISIFSVYSALNIPDSAKIYFDNHLVKRISDLGRFNVLGFQYRLDGNSASQFLEKIRELKKQQILSDESLIDERIGVVVLPAEELYKMLNSVFIFIPTISGWNVSSYEIKVNVKKGDSIVVETKTEHKAEVTISVQIIDGEGTLRQTYLATREATSRDSQVDAYQKAVDNAIAGLTLFLRNTDEFKLRTRVLQRQGRKIALELGRDLGLRAGYEFAIQTRSVLTGGFTMTGTTGLVRVSQVGDNFSWAHVIHGNPQPEEQLIEMPMANKRISLYGGISTMNVQKADIDFIYVDPSGIIEASGLTLSPASIVPDIGIKFENELGYAGLLRAKMGFLLNNPWALYLDLGGAYELYLGPVSFDIGGDLSILGNYFKVGTIPEQFFGVKIDDTWFYNKIDVNLVGITLGLKPALGFNIQFSQRFKLRAYGGYQIYFLPFYSISFTDSKDSEKSASVPLTDSSVYFRVNGEEATGLPIDFNGVFGGIEFILRF
jgi:hypothetical protein